MPDSEAMYANLENIKGYYPIFRPTYKIFYDIIEKLKSTFVASAFSLNILDLNENKALNIEKDIKEIYITNILDRYARSNHFIAKQDNLPVVPEFSDFRYYMSKQLINKLNKDSVKMDDLVSILNYETEDYYKSIFKSPKKYNDKSITVANFSCNSDLKEILIKDYLDNSELKFSLNSLCKRKNIVILMH